MGGTSPEAGYRARTDCLIFDPAGGGSWATGPALPASVSWGASWSARGESLLVVSGGRWDEAARTHVFESRCFVLEGDE